MNPKSEILAPAGSMESLVAAVQSGADAVYLGSDSLNARRNAANFSGDELKKAVDYCHLRGVKVYLTLNTLVTDHELPETENIIKKAAEYGIDAFIIQDLAVLEITKQLAPDIKLHASTQMAVMNTEGFKELERLGFERAVIPREFCREEIAEVQQNTNLELEVFVHGALCMCVSGQCYLSGMLGGRSGNRGLCAQPCRLPFAAPDGTGHDLSLKDLSLLPYLRDMEKQGIASFKIEGRMKRPEYVAAAVTACRTELDEKKNRQLEHDLKSVFSRSGFTDGYYRRNMGRNMFGIRSKEDVKAAEEPVLKRLESLYKEDNRNRFVSMTFTAKIGEPMSLRVSTGREHVCVNSEDYKVEKALNVATDKERIKAQLKKTGGTGLEVKMTELYMDEGINIPISKLNKLRRQAVDELTKKLNGSYIHSINPNFSLETLKSDSLIPSLKADKVPWILRFDSDKQLPSFSFLKSIKRDIEVLIPLLSEEGTFAALRKEGIPFGVEIPRALYGFQGRIKKALKNIKNSGASFVYAGTMDGIALAKKTGLPIIGGFTLNVFNSIALNEYKKLGIERMVLSTELTLSEIEALKSPLKTGIVAYGRTPLMLMRNCPIKNGLTCDQCGRNRSLKDRMGIEFPVRCNNGASELLNSRPLYLGDRLNEINGPSFLLIYFTVENEFQIERTLKEIEAGESFKGKFTRGLYYRGVK